MKLDVVLLPRDLTPPDLTGRTVVVFDVLRATTSITAALTAGVLEIRVYPTTGEAAGAARAYQEAGGPPRPLSLLSGEEKTLRPPGFDLGNSPGAFNRAEHASRVMFLSTTNGTKAILAARSASKIFTGALVNAAAVAAALDATGADVTLLCSGTNGEVSMEDLLGAGAVMDALASRRPLEVSDDRARLARRLFENSRGDLHAVLADSQGGHNCTAAGLGEDVAFASRLDVFDLVGFVAETTAGGTPVLRQWHRH